MWELLYLRKHEKRGVLFFYMDFWDFGSINQIFSINLLIIYVDIMYIFTKTSIAAPSEVYLCMEEITESLKQ